MDFVELKNGSVFCACLKPQFIEALKQLLTLGLDEIYIEGSGLADPSDMGKVIQVLKKELPHIAFQFVATICLVDGLYFQAELEKMVSVGRQIAHSHYIFINKCDLIDESQLSQVMDLIRSLNQQAVILPVTQGVVDFEDLQLSYYHIEDEETTNRKDNKPKCAILHFDESPTKVQLENFLKKLVDHFYRIKGFVKMEDHWYKVDLVNKRIDVIEFGPVGMDENQDGMNELVCLSSRGVAGISHLATTMKNALPVACRIEV